MTTTMEPDMAMLKRSLTCEICAELFASPFMLFCGHVFCYGCILDWLLHKRTCPTCRQSICQRPALAYFVQEMVEVFVRRMEAQDPDGEGYAARIHQQEQRQRMENNKESLFYDLFSETSGFAGVLRDREDGVMRCIQCYWEIEGPACTHCGFQFSDENFGSLDDFSDRHAVLESHGHPDSLDHDSISSEQDDYDYDDPFIDDRPTDEIERYMSASGNSCSKNASQQTFSASYSDILGDDEFDGTDQDSFVQEQKQRLKRNRRRLNSTALRMQRFKDLPISIQSDESINTQGNISTLFDSGPVLISSSSVEKDSKRHVIHLLSNSSRKFQGSGPVNSDDNVSSDLSDNHVIMPLQIDQPVKKSSNKLRKHRRMINIPSSNGNSDHSE
ncbi:ubiquitin-protein ligase PSH1 [Pneumocystis jirovecii RU7]|uniref:RING-type domain-containing protein n=1 Tax=Pneumocystis jirovecii (strain RU7) TaxID=1408657 RepID=A0A0W4ZUT2_PNEJ7|nr:ubiquitin-protein ligase PSH1 [Pneumocystis jirovecii RU7]KTW32142.1 hypothetical protein T551_00824 [Pneumocystis jirovecii RU7]